MTNRKLKLTDLTAAVREERSCSLICVTTYTQLNSDAGVTEFFRVSVRALPPRPSSPSSEGTRKKNVERAEWDINISDVFGTACPDLSLLSVFTHKITLCHHFI